MVGAVAPEAGDAVGVAATGDWEVGGVAGVAALVDEATALVAAGPGDVAVPAGGVWPAGGAVRSLGALPLAVGVT